LYSISVAHTYLLRYGVVNINSAKRFEMISNDSRLFQIQRSRCLGI